jgi:crossover junction endodeoxyribonuclease RuvC
MRVLGIDPGLCVTGYVIMEIDGTKSELIAGGCIYTDSSKQRLRAIYEGLLTIIRGFEPTLAVVECTFVNINPRTSLALGQARGACLVSLEVMDIQYVEISTSVIRKRLLNRGNATKKEVQTLIQGLFNIKFCDHISDAIASILSILSDKIISNNLLINPIQAAN